MSPGRQRDAFAAAPVGLSDSAADAVLGVIATAQRPFLLAGPALANPSGRDLLQRIEAALQIPTAIMDSPRGFNDATLGAFADAIRRADLIVLLGKAFDFTLRFGAPPSVDPACRWVVIDPEAALVDRAGGEKRDLLAFGCVADTRAAGEALIRRATAKVRCGMACRRTCTVQQPPGRLGNARVKDTRKTAPDRGVPRAQATCGGAAIRC